VVVGKVVVRRGWGIALGGALLLAACAQTPQNSTVAVMPSQSASFGQFQQDQANCRAFAQQQVAGQAEDANHRAIGAAAVGTLAGAGLGLIGGSFAGRAGMGAGIGAATGAALGAGTGAVMSNNQNAAIQQQFDNAYASCMAARGHTVAGMAPPPTQASTISPNDPALVRSVQSELIRLNMLPPPADGIAGPQTISAITRFQQQAGMQPTGQASPTLLARLQATQ
jgi:hypothetical protein